MLSQEMIQKLMTAGLNKNQATSVTADTVVNLLMDADGKALIAEARTQVSEMKKILLGMQQEYWALSKKMQDACEGLAGIIEAQNDYGAVTTEKAKEVIALYGALLSMGERKGTTGNDVVNAASYIVYAFLDGQAKREITYMEPKK